MFSRAVVPLFAIATLALTGCGSGSSTAPVKGRVTCFGKPVVNAVVLFSPLPKTDDDTEPGKAGCASTDGDGYYVVTTYRKGDGAHVGEVRVVVTLDASIPCDCLSKIFVREVRQGSNEINLELGAEQ